MTLRKIVQSIKISSFAIACTLLTFKKYQTYGNDETAPVLQYSARTANVGEPSGSDKGTGYTILRQYALKPNTGRKDYGRKQQRT